MMEELRMRLEMKVILRCASFVGLEVGCRMMGERFGMTDVREIQIFFNVKINDSLK